MGEQIKLLRKHYKMTQTEFGQKIGVSRDVINNIENKVTESDKKLIDNKLKAYEKLMLIYVHNKTINVSFTENFTLI